MNKRWSVTAVVSMLLVAVVLTGLGVAGGPSSTPPGLARAIAAQEAHTDALLGHAGVVGTAVGLDDQGSPVVKIYTESGNVTGLPHSLDGVATAVEVTGELVARQLTRPSNTGVSSGTERLMVYHGGLYCTTGTLGARVTDGTNVYALSNAHVYALQGSTPSGTVTVGANGDRALQPGRVDMTSQACGSKAEIDAAVIGNLWDFVSIDFSRTAQNTVDAAIARVTTDKVGRAVPGYCDSYVPALTTVTATLGLPVQKCGRTTKLTKGTVSGTNATVMISYDKGRAKFIKQIVVTALSAGGDSGSLIVTQSGGANPNPVALLFAGSSSTTIGNPIDLVLSSFGVHVDGP
jgi:hypothetical protein